MNEAVRPFNEQEPQNLRPGAADAPGIRWRAAKIRDGFRRPSR